MNLDLLLLICWISCAVVVLYCATCLQSQRSVKIGTTAFVLMWACWFAMLGVFAARA